MTTMFTGSFRWTRSSGNVFRKRSRFALSRVALNNDHRIVLDNREKFLLLKENGQFLFGIDRLTNLFIINKQGVTRRSRSSPSPRSLRCPTDRCSSSFSSRMLTQLSRVSDEHELPIVVCPSSTIGGSLFPYWRNSSS